MLGLMGIASLQIGQVAHKTGLSVDAIRFYEKSGLLPRPARTQGGYRLYAEREIADLEFIQKAQRLGFSLNEIRELFSIQRRPHVGLRARPGFDRAEAGRGPSEDFRAAGVGNGAGRSIAAMPRGSAATGEASRLVPGSGSDYAPLPKKEKT
jgi:DNA-binding transcriptional MerR regulator